jgi:iron complex transport system substrate-binding protein
LLVEGVVVAGFKSVENLAPVDSKQVLIYLRLLNLPVGRLLNCGAAAMKEGMNRIVTKYTPPPSATPRLRVKQQCG